jgi:hypothetical protein
MIHVHLIYLLLIFILGLAAGFGLFLWLDDKTL